MKAFSTLLKTELKLSLRGLDMFIFAICMPVILVVILGAVFGDRPAFEGAEYTFFQQSFGAISTVAIAAGGVMGLPLVISDYRGKGILKRFKVTPASPVLLLTVQVVIYMLYALASLGIVYLTARVFFRYEFLGNVVPFFTAYFLVMISMFSIGILVGGLARNIKVAGIIASILYFPMLIFSGATLPYEIMPKIFQKIADLMPLTQGIKLLKAASLGLSLEVARTSVFIMIAIAMVSLVVAIRYFKWE